MEHTPSLPLRTILISALYLSGDAFCLLHILLTQPPLEVAHLANNFTL